MIRRLYVAESLSGITKVGMSAHPFQRQIGLRQQIGEKVRVVWVAPWEWGDCWFVEIETCNRLLPYRVFGEWFDVSTDFAIRTADGARDYLDATKGRFNRWASLLMAFRANGAALREEWKARLKERENILTTNEPSEPAKRSDKAA